MKDAKSALSDDSHEAVVAELRDIKRLLVLLLLKGGASQTEIAKALEVAQATVSRQFGMGKVKPFGAELASSSEQNGG
jgi:predicted transcriptional regulator